MKRGILCNQMMRLGTHMATIFDREMSNYGLNQAQFRNLLELSKERLTPTELADRLMLKKAPVSLIISRMVEAGLLERHPGPNRRTHFVAITSSGLDFLEQALEPAIRLAEETTKVLDDDEVELLQGLLDRLESHLRSAP